jgi:hypothetical protein
MTLSHFSNEQQISGEDICLFVALGVYLMFTVICFLCALAATAAQEVQK